MAHSHEGPRTFSVDCGGTGLKATVLDADGTQLRERVRMRTPYPCPPDVLVDSVESLAEQTDTPFDRVSVGFPGMIRNGVVLATPHYVAETGPYTPSRTDLVDAWSHYDIRAHLEHAFGRPTKVVNDAEIAGLAVIEGQGFEVMITLGTGMGFALFDDGRLLPKIEMSHAPFRKGETYDQQIGRTARKRLGTHDWVLRVRMAIDALRPVLWWDRLFIGGGSARHLPVDFGHDVTVVANDAGLRGGIALWK